MRLTSKKLKRPLLIRVWLFYNIFLILASIYLLTEAIFGNVDLSKFYGFSNILSIVVLSIVFCLSLSILITSRSKDKTFYYVSIIEQAIMLFFSIFSTVITSSIFRWVGTFIMSCVFIASIKYNTYFSKYIET